MASPRCLHSAAFDLLDDSRIEQRGGVTEILHLAFRDLSKDAAHDLAAPGFRKTIHQLDLVRPGNGSDDPRDSLADIFSDRTFVRLVSAEDHISVNSLTLYLVRIAYDSALDDPRVHIDGVLDLCRADPVATDIQDIVDAPGDPIIAFVVPQRSIARKI